MARIGRVVVPDIPHHITQRGNRGQDVFFCKDDYEEYVSLMREWCDKCDVEIWAYCLMRNHVHLLAVPKSEDGLRRGIGEAHRQAPGKRCVRYWNREEAKANTAQTETRSKEAQKETDTPARRS